MKDPCKECIIKGNCSTFCKEKIWSLMDNGKTSNLAEIQELFRKEKKKFEQEST
jgi:hypothetical protein